MWVLARGTEGKQALNGSGDTRAVGESYQGHTLAYGSVATF